MSAPQNDAFKYFDNKDMDRIKDDFVENNYMAPIFDDMIAGLAFRIVCDIGCGNGLFTSYLKERTGCYLVGIDGSAYGLKQAAERGYDNTVLVSDMCNEKLPVEDESFDLVVCKDVLEHLLDPLAVMRETVRVLKPGRHALISVPNHFTLFHRLKFLISNKIDTLDCFPESEEWNFPHIRFFTMQGLVQLLNEVGLEVVKDYSSSFAFVMPYIQRLPFGTTISRFLAEHAPSQFASGFVLLCRKRNGGKLTDAG